MNIAPKLQIVSVIVGVFALFPAMTSHAEGWDWTVTPYLWAASNKLDLGVVIPPDDDQAGSEASFSDLLDTLDFGAQVHVEGYKGRYGMMLDITNLQVSDRTTQGLLELDSDASLSLIEGAALLRIGDSSPQTELILGFRSINLDLELELEGLGADGNVIEQSIDKTLTDAMVGARFTFPLSERWNLSLRGDVASGDTDFSWNASAMFGYRFPTAGTVLLGYRYLNIDFDNEDRFLKPELTMCGAQVGYACHF
jgi:hypothetical protein